MVMEVFVHERPQIVTYNSLMLFQAHELFFSYCLNYIKHVFLLYSVSVSQPQDLSKIIT